MVRAENLEKMQKDKTKDANYHLVEAFKSNSFTQMRTALKLTHVDVNYEDPKDENMSPMMKLCFTELTPKNRRELARQMIGNPHLDINSQDDNGKTALHHACYMEHEDLVRVFSEDIDIDPNIADDDGNTPLMVAARTGNTSVVIALINCFKKFGLRVDEPNNLGLTPLLEATKLGYTDMSRILVTMGKADLTVRDKVDYGTAEEYAMESGRCGTPDILILSPIAQKKTELRRARQARGRKLLSDYMSVTKCAPVSKSTPISDPRKDYGVFFVSRNGLNQEQMQCRNRMTFQMGRHIMHRLTEQPAAEEAEQDEMQKYFEQLRRHSNSLPNLAELSTYENDHRHDYVDPVLSKSLPSSECRERAWTTGNVKLPPVRQSTCSPKLSNSTRLSTSSPSSLTAETESSRQRRVGVVSRHSSPPSPSTPPKNPPKNPRQLSPTVPRRKISLPSRLPSMPHTTPQKSPPGSPRQRKVSAPSMVHRPQKGLREIRSTHAKHPPNAIPSHVYSEW
ncbi:uncharacterized protein LOC144447429 [Glandiceps talaboti]